MQGAAKSTQEADSSGQKIGRRNIHDLGSCSERCTMTLFRILTPPRQFA
jgi:hypothetical protein